MPNKDLLRGVAENDEKLCKLAEKHFHVASQGVTTFNVNFEISFENNTLQIRRLNDFIYDFIGELYKMQKKLKEGENISIKTFSCTKE